MSTSNTSPSTSTTGGGCPFHRGEDDTLSLLRLGYRFLPTLREERTGADDDRPFRFGLLGRRAHALRGSAGAVLPALVAGVWPGPSGALSTARHVTW